MDQIRVIHTHEPGYGWSFESPDLPDMVGGADSYGESCRLAESAVRFTLDCRRAEDAAVEVAAAPQVVHYRSGDVRARAV